MRVKKYIGAEIEETGGLGDAGEERVLLIGSHRIIVGSTQKLLQVLLLGTQNLEILLTEILGPHAKLFL